MARKYFSDREAGPRSLTETDVAARAWGGIVSLVDAGVSRGVFAEAFPEQCPDGRGVVGTDWRALKLAVEADVPDARWPLDGHDVPPTLVVLDLIEFFHDQASEASHRDFHSFYGHHHLRFDRPAGQAAFRERINTIFSRNGLAYALGADGRVTRVFDSIVQQMLDDAVPDSEDDTLNDLIERAAAKFADPNSVVRRESLEQLWDAFERAKTLLDPDKKRGSAALIASAASSPDEEGLLEADMLALTSAGNTFRIRHHETTTVEVADSVVDYLFVRMYSLLRRLLRALD